MDTPRSDVAARFIRAVAATPGVAAARSLRRRLSKDLRSLPAEAVRDLGLEIVAAGHRWQGYEILSNRADVLMTLTPAQIESLGDGLSDWGSIDAYGVLLAGPAWIAGVLSDRDVTRWTQSGNLWRRRAALVATVPWNTRSRGGVGDVERTLMVCTLLVADHEAMVVKALSWALRALAAWAPEAVDAFVVRHDAVLAARIKREVRNKLRTGRKSGKQ